METRFRKGRSFLIMSPWRCKGCSLPFDPESKSILIIGKFGKVEGWGCPSNECAFVDITWFNQFYPYEKVENIIGYTLTEALQGRRELTPEGLELIKGLLDLDREIIQTFG